MSHNAHSSTDASTCKMDMLFNTYTIDACFLTPEWQIKNNGMFAATCIGVLLMVVLLEFCRRMGKEYDDFLARQFRQQAAVASARRAQLENMELGVDEESAVVGCAPTNAAATTTLKPRSPSYGGTTTTVTFRASPLQQLIRAVLHAITFGLAYIVMLIAMYYNVILLVMIILGAGIGKFFCDWMTRTIVVEVDDGGAAAATAGDGGSSKGVEEPSVCCG